MKRISVPPELTKLEALIQASVRPYLRITAKREPTRTRRESKIGGKPYYPKQLEYPRTTKGRPLELLAQLNLEEAPALEGFPEKGILQFYLTDAIFDTPEPRVLYFPEVDKNPQHLISDFSFLPKFSDGSPLQESFPNSLQFERRYAPASPHDFKFAQLFGQDAFFIFKALGGSDKRADQLFHQYDELAESFGHKLGGYAGFTQEDDRTPQTEELLLLQLDTDGESGLHWGDAGIAHYFITPADLATRDFSKVRFHWDCL